MIFSIISNKLKMSFKLSCYIIILLIIMGKNKKNSAKDAKVAAKLLKHKKNKQK